jgi:hypothetical protein
MPPRNRELLRPRCAPSWVELVWCLRRQRGTRVGSCFRLRLGFDRKPHGGPGGSLDLVVGQIEPRTAAALHPIATVRRKDHQLVAVMGHIPRVLPRSVDLFS